MWSALKKLFRRGPASLWRAPARDSGRGGGRASGAAPTPGRDLIEQLENQFERADDVKFRFVSLGEDGPEAAVAYIEGLVDGARIEEALLRPLLQWAHGASDRDIGDVHRDPELLGERVLTASEVDVIDNLEEASEALLKGDTVFAFRGHRHGLEISNRGWQSRGVEEPLLEVTVRGPRDSFTENLLWNTALLRRRIRDPQLRIEILTIGRRSRTSVALVHIDGVTPDFLIDEVRERLEAIDIDGILDTGYIEHLIEDEWWSPFPHHLKTERPDKVAAALLEGRAAVFADTTPFVLIMPAISIGKHNFFLAPL